MAARSGLRERRKSLAMRQSQSAKSLAVYGPLHSAAGPAGSLRCWSNSFSRSSWGIVEAGRLDHCPGGEARANATDEATAAPSTPVGGSGRRRAAPGGRSVRRVAQEQL